MNKYYVIFVDDRLTDIKVFNENEKSSMEEFVKDIKTKEAINGSTYGIEKIIKGEELSFNFELKGDLKFDNVL